MARGPRGQGESAWACAAGGIACRIRPRPGAMINYLVGNVTYESW
jgi:hypothetical protein